MERTCDDDTVMDLGLSGKACVVTGASIGIGLAVSERLAQEGASVLMVARDEERLAEAAAQAGADYIAADVTDPDADERIIATCVERMGGIDVLVNNAGANFARPLDELTDDDWNGLWALHVLAPMRLMRAAAPRMADRGGGRIVNVSSSAGKRPSLDQRCLLGDQVGASSRCRASSPTRTRGRGFWSTQSRPAPPNRRTGWRPAGSPIRSLQRAASTARR